jgi:hypothetical protein
LVGGWVGVGVGVGAVWGGYGERVEYKLVLA